MYIHICIYIYRYCPYTVLSELCNGLALYTSSQVGAETNRHALYGLPLSTQSIGSYSERATKELQETYKNNGCLADAMVYIDLSPGHASCTRVGSSGLLLRNLI